MKKQIITAIAIISLLPLFMASAQVPGGAITTGKMPAAAMPGSKMPSAAMPTGALPGGTAIDIDPMMATSSPMMGSGVAMATTSMPMGGMPGGMFPPDVVIQVAELQADAKITKRMTLVALLVAVTALGLAIAALRRRSTTQA